MLKSISLFRLGVRCCGKCQSLVNAASTSAVVQKNMHLKEKLNFLENEKKKYENTFGDIDSFERRFDRIQEDPEDVALYEQQRRAKGKAIIEYQTEISNLLRKQNYKEAIRVLEEDMVDDKITYTNLKVVGIFRMLINYNALRGDVKEAYRLYTRYKERQGTVVGQMYSSLFNACANCKNSLLALRKAELLREHLANDKFHKANIYNYNAMLKAFARHGDIPTCLNIFDEILQKRGKAFTPTYNFLLQSCISDKNSGLRHALLVWRKMLQFKRLPDIYFFNLFLRCIRECSLGEVTLIPDLIQQINQESGKFFKKKIVIKKIKGKEVKNVVNVPVTGEAYLAKISDTDTQQVSNKNDPPKSAEAVEIVAVESSQSDTEKMYLSSDLSADNVKQIESKEDEMKSESSEVELYEKEEENFEGLQVLESNSDESERVEEHNILLPDLLALQPTTGSAIDFGAMTEPHHRIMLFGGVTGFLNTMAKFKVKPNILTLSLLLNVSPPTEEAEQKILNLVKLYKIELDSAFFSQLLKKRIFSDRRYLIKDTLNEMQKANVQPDLICFGVLAFACDSREKGMDLLEKLKLYGYRPNCEILYGLLCQAGRSKDFVYVKEILDKAKAEDVELNSKFIVKLRKIVDGESYQRMKSYRKPSSDEDDFDEGADTVDSYTETEGKA